MAFAADLTGKEYGRLKVVKLAWKNGCAYWWCECSCGRAVVAVRSDSLRNGHTQSCGCIATERIVKHNKKHGFTRTRLFNIWRGMKQRCEYPKHPFFKDYGARGVTVCEEWHDSATFFAWALANGYTEELTIDRVNVDGNYEPSNCRWITNAEQQLNKRKNMPMANAVMNETAEEFWKDTPDEPAPAFDPFYY